MHISVLLNQCIENLNLKEDSIIVDCTLGYAGHSSEILKRIPNGKLYCFEQDSEAIYYSDNKLKQISSNYEIIKSNFKNIKKELNKRNIKKVDGILYDLGVSSPQLDEIDRGFSFHNDARLDMRMDQTNELDAYKVINSYSASELTNIFIKYGEEKYAKSIANKIVEYRKEKDIVTTLELVNIIQKSVPFKYSREKHPARKVFQAIRIEVNDELNVFEKSLTDSLELLNIKGRICVITFHSLEDKLCKQIFNKVSKLDDSLKKLPVIPDNYLPDFKTLKTIEPDNNEIDKNKRSRSSKLRIIERVK